MAERRRQSNASSGPGAFPTVGHNGYKSHALSAAELATAAEQLAARRRELTREWDECMRELRSGTETKSADDDCAECLSDAVLTSSLQHLSQHIREIDLAMTRLAGGEYGLCETCSEPITAARLQANPAAVCCIGCQRRKEGRRRA